MKIKPETTRRGTPDIIMFTATVVLLGLGLVMVMSASSAMALSRFNDPFHYIKRQLIWATGGLIAMAVLSRTDYRILRKVARGGLAVAFLLLVVVLFAGVEISGSRRWIDLGVLSLQPSEVAKFAVINFVAAFCAARRESIRRFGSGLVPPLAVAAAAFALVMLEPDFGTAGVLVVTVVVMLFAAGAQIYQLCLVGAAALPLMGLLVWIEPYRFQRILAFLDPWKDPSDTGWNVIQSLLALGSGGLFGLGLGESRQKFAYLPEQHTDFIFAILGEELGFVGTVVVVALFFVLGWRGYRTAMLAPDLFGSVLAVGLTTMIVLQAVINVGVVTGSLPITGITLPMISFGGSSLSVTLAGIGVLMNISRQSGSSTPL